MTVRRPSFKTRGSGLLVVLTCTFLWQVILNPSNQCPTNCRTKSSCLTDEHMTLYSLSRATLVQAAVLDSTYKTSHLTPRSKMMPSTVHLLLLTYLILLQAGDIEMNPGPSICSANNESAFACNKAYMLWKCELVCGCCPV